MKEDAKDLAGCRLGCFGVIIATLIVVDLIVLGIKSAIWLWNL